MVNFGIIITLALIALGILFKRSRVIACVQTFWLWIVTGFTNGGGDYSENLAIYQGYARSSSSSFFDWFARPVSGFLQNRFGWEYWQYNALMCGVVLILLFLVAHKNTKNIALFFSMFLIYPFVDSVMQKKVFLCIHIINYRYIMPKEQKI